LTLLTPVIRADISEEYPPVCDSLSRLLYRSIYSYLPTALAGKLKQSAATQRPSVHLSVRLFPLHLLNRLTLNLNFWVCVVIAVARLGLKVKVICQGKRGPNISLYIRTITLELNDLLPKYLAHWFTLTLSGSHLKVKVTRHRSRSQEENAAKMVSAALIEGFQLLSSSLLLLLSLGRIAASASGSGLLLCLPVCLTVCLSVC